MIHTDTYTFKYNSDEESIDLNTLLLSQIHFSTILNEIKNEVAGDAKLSVRIKPLSKGSVPFDISLVVSWVQNLITWTNIDYASEIVTILVGLIQLRIWLKGSKPDTIEIKGDKVIITKGDVQIIVDRNTYIIAENNSVVDKALQKGFEAIEKDESVNGIEILDQNKKSLIEVPREEFANLITTNEVIEELIQVEEPKIEQLSIFKVVFDKGYKWQFYLHGRKISATIADNNFMERINNGEPFAKGDILTVELEKEKVFDKSLNIYVEKEFKILNVLKHDPRLEGSQRPLF